MYSVLEKNRRENNFYWDSPENLTEKIRNDI